MARQNYQKAGRIGRWCVFISFVPLVGDNFHTVYYHSEGRDQGAALSIVAGAHFFQYAVFAPGFSRVTELAHLHTSGETDLFAQPEHLESLFRNFSLEGHFFSKVNVALLNTDFVMLPAAFADHADLRQMLSFSTASAGPADITRHQVGDIGFGALHSQQVTQAVGRAFSNASVRHTGAVSLHLLAGHPALRECGALLNVYQGMIELAVRRNGSVEFYNAFAVNTDEDILYYVLFVAEQFGIDISQWRLGVGGQVEPGNSAGTLLHQCLPRLSLAGLHQGLTMEGKLREVPPHLYFTLLNQHLCEL